MTKNNVHQTAIQDPHSFAHPTRARVTHLTWTGQVDFESRMISATATWDLMVGRDVQEVIFDTKGLRIESVAVDGVPTDAFKIGIEDPLLGAPLQISIRETTTRVSVTYRTSPKAEALQWLSPTQTAGRKYAFLFTQSQAILARSWIPCQDSPGVRFTYQASVSVPSTLLALMSASNPQSRRDDGHYTFEMKQPIPAYLMALVVGDVRFSPISDRCGIYAEPTAIQAATWEFADLEKMVATAESLYGTYPWARYDVIVLPPSFPFGGMENPKLTFVTPTIIAGDRSLTSLIAHELAHSWSGNLVTNRTWNDFWVNEGFTVYFEHRIMEQLYGRDFSEMLATLALHDLIETIEDLKSKDQFDDTRLRLNLKGRNPDEGVTDIAYNKGYFLLRHIEETHGRKVFDDFLRTYFGDHRFASMDTDQFIAYIQRHYARRVGTRLDFLERWIDGTGLPEDCPSPRSSRLEAVSAFAKHWMRGDGGTDIPGPESTQEWLHFLKQIPEPLSHEQMRRLDEFGRFTQSGNAEILAVWYVLVVRYDYDLAFANLEEFLVRTGRRKFLLPIYQELLKSVRGTQMAHTIYGRARSGYHFVSTNTLDPLLGFKP